jgi:hypothetical protein
MVERTGFFGKVLLTPNYGPHLTLPWMTLPLKSIPSFLSISEKNFLRIKNSEIKAKKSK